MENHGTPFEHRFRVLREKVEALKALWTEDEAAYKGKYVSFDPVWSFPKPVQKPHPPILIGGIANPALKRVVRYGDGWLAVALDAIRMKERLSTLKQLCESSGRVFDDLDLVYKIFINPGEAKKGPFGEREIGSGSEQQIIDDLKSILGAGFSSIIVRYRGDSAKAQQLQMERFAEEIIPSL